MSSFPPDKPIRPKFAPRHKRSQSAPAITTVSPASKKQSYMTPSDIEASGKPSNIQPWDIHHPDRRHRHRRSVELTKEQRGLLPSRPKRSVSVDIDMIRKPVKKPTTRPNVMASWSYPRKPQHHRTSSESVNRTHETANLLKAAESREKTATERTSQPGPLKKVWNFLSNPFAAVKGAMASNKDFFEQSKTVNIFIEIPLPKTEGVKLIDPNKKAERFQVFGKHKRVREILAEETEVRDPENIWGREIRRAMRKLKLQSK